MKRQVEIKRKTEETDIVLALNLDGKGEVNLETGLPFINHMLELWAKHGFFNLTIKAKGDLEVEPHHLVEDIGICLGQALKQALGSKEGIRRYGFSSVPMDESLVTATIDLSGRPYLHYHVKLPAGRVGTMDPEVFQEFWQAFVNESCITVHLVMNYGRNKHHIIEASYKAAGRALNEATSYLDNYEGILSTKGKL